MKRVSLLSCIGLLLCMLTTQLKAADPFIDPPEKDDLPAMTSPGSTSRASRIVRDPNHVGTRPSPHTMIALQASQNAGGRIALNVARIWLMEHGLRVTERRAGARQIVIVEYTHPLTVHVRGIDTETREVQWAGG